jgi:outer membrane protein
MGNLKARLNEVLSTIAQQRGLALIVNTDSEACPFINPLMGEDINEIVKDALK